MGARWGVLLQQSATGSDPIEWLQYGVLGLVILALLTGWLWAKPAVQHIIDDKEELARQIDALITAVRELRDEVRGLREDLNRERRR